MADGGADYYRRREWWDNAVCILEYRTTEGVARASVHFDAVNGLGGCYERLMGGDGSIRMSEDAPNGNYTQREAHAPDWSPFERNGGLTRLDDFVLPSFVEPPFRVDVRPSSRRLDPLELFRGHLLYETLDKPVHTPHLANFFDAVRDGASLNCPGELGYAGLVIAEKANRAIVEGKRIHLDAGEFVV